MTDTQETIVGRIESKSRADADAIVATAEKVGRREMEQAELRSNTRGELARKELQAQLAAEKELARATAGAEASRIKLQEKQVLVQEAFDSALKRIADIPRDEAYLAVVARLSREAVEALGAKEVVLAFSSRDREFMALEGRFQRLAESLGAALGVSVGLADETIEAAGGVVARTADGRISYYNTFDEIAYRRRCELRAMIAKLLFE
jgi:vacuolar-type H+-ATPase subunit E/Vma4